MTSSPVSSVTAHFTYLDLEETPLRETSPDYYFCAIAHEQATGKFAYALAISKVATETLGLVFQVQERPFPEMAFYISQNLTHRVPHVNENLRQNQYRLYHWVQQYEPRNGSWRINQPIDHNTRVERMLINIYVEQSLFPSAGILKAISIFKKQFPRYNPDESALIVKYAELKPLRADGFLSLEDLPEVRFKSK